MYKNRNIDQFEYNFADVNKMITLTFIASTQLPTSNNKIAASHPSADLCTMFLERRMLILDH